MSLFFYFFIYIFSFSLNILSFLFHFFYLLLKLQNHSRGIYFFYPSILNILSDKCFYPCPNTIYNDTTGSLALLLTEFQKILYLILSFFLFLSIYSFLYTSPSILIF